MTTLSKVDVTGQWTLVYDASVSGQFRGSVFSITQDEVSYRVAQSAPASSDPGVPASGKIAIALSENRGDKLYAKSADGSSSVIMDDSAGLALIPPWMITSPVENMGRIPVDSGETGFFEGREFRVTQKIRLAAGEELVYKNVLAVDIIIQRFDFQITDGNYEVHVWTSDNVSEDIAFTETLTPAPKNVSAEFREYDGGRYETQMTITSSGVVTAGTAITVTDTEQYVDYLELKTSGSTAHAAGVSASSDSNRYTPSPVTFYTQIVNIGTGAVRGVINNEWEERPLSAQLGL